MQLSQLREDIKRCLATTIKEFAESELGISEVSLHRKLSGKHPFTAVELLKINRRVFSTLPLKTFLMAYGFTPGTYTPLELTLDAYADLLEYLDTIKGVYVPMAPGMRMGHIVYEIEKENRLG